MKVPGIEIPFLPNCYRVKHQEYLSSRKILGMAFQEDPLWNIVFPSNPEKIPLFFGIPLKLGLKYGKVYAPTNSLEGIAIWLGSSYVDTSFRYLLRSGALFAGLQVGLRKSLQIDKMYEAIAKDRHFLLKTPYLYLYVLGVHPDHQNRGLGTLLTQKMLNALPYKTPVILETEKESNVRFYERLGFSVENKVMLPEIDYPMWEMIYWNK